MMKQKKELTWLLQQAKPAAGGILLLAVGCSISAGISVMYALAMKELVDNAIHQAMTGFIRAVLLYLVLMGSQLVLVTVLNLAEEKIYAQLERRIQLSIFETLTRMEHQSFSAYHTGTLLSHITADVSTVVQQAIELLPGVLSLLVKLTVAVTLLILWDKRFTLLLLLGGGTIMIAAQLMRRKMKQAQREVREENDKLWSFLEEILRSMPILKTFCVQRQMKEQLDVRIRHMQGVRFYQVLLSNLCNRGFTLAINGGYLFGLVWCGVGLMQGTMSYGTLTAVLQLVNQIQYPVSQLGGYISRYYAMCASAERLMELEMQPFEAVEGMEHAVEECASLYKRMESIRAEGLSFSYGERSIYSEASLCIRRGETVAFVGGSGIGKSTFLKLLLAVYPPYSGGLWVECPDGTKTPISVETRALFAYVPQDNTLLSGSIWEDVTLFKKRGELSEEEWARVKEVCRIACAEEFISALPQGYDTVLREDGNNLSEGQKQRLAIARALYVDRPILLLDEATSALDEATEARLLSNLRQSTENKTILIVTHRPAALALCDRVFEVEQGQFRERKVERESR